MESTLPTYDFCILGAGIAGLSLADALHEKGYRIVVLEKNKIASGASGTPAGLVNPATGRKAKKSWKAELCYEAILQNLHKIQDFSNQPFFKTNGLLRPALSSKMARKMKEQFDKTHWPEGWCHWLSEKKIKEKHPGINCINGGLWLPIGLTVDVKVYLKAYAAYLQSQHVGTQTNAGEAQFQQTDDSWVVHTSNNKIQSNHLVFATGFSTVHHPWWKHLPLEGVKGELARFKASEKKLSFEHSISSMGYIARLDKKDEFIQGSTYNHNFKNELEPTAEGLEYLKNRLTKTLPDVAREAHLIEQWSGVRVNTPNRKPVIGLHPEIKNLHAFTGLGSKGLMYGKFVADHYADHLKNGTEIFERISVHRFK